MSEASSKIVRFSKGNACPICGGTDQDARGSGERCFGFRSGKWIHCSREEYAGKARLNDRSQTYAHVATGPCPCGTEHAPVEPGLVLGRPLRRGPEGTFERAYEYKDREGKTRYENVRYRNPKDFRHRRLDASGKYRWNLDGLERLLYHLPELIAADPSATVWVCEGEKDVERLESLGLVATTGGAAGKWLDIFAEELRGRSVAISPHNDDDGHRCGQQIARSLYGKAVSVKVVELTGDMPELPEKGDVSNWLDAGRTVERLLELYRNAPEWTPAEAGMGVKPSANGHTEGDGRVLWLPDGGINYDALTLDELNIRVASKVRMRPTKWMWQHRLAVGEMALIAGEGGLGKSQLMLWICTAVTRGSEWPDKTGHAPLGSVIIVTAEDSAETTIVPRLMAMGADLDKVMITEAPKSMVREEGKKLVVQLECLSSLGYWRSVLDKCPDTKLLIVDPVASFLGRGVSGQKDDEIRGVIEPFIEQIVRPKGFCFLANTHLNKNLEAKTIKHRINGAIGWVNVPRNVHVVLRDEDDPKLRLFGQVKTNIAPDDLPSFKFKIETRTVESDDGPIETSVPVFLDELVEIDLNVMSDKKRPGRKPLQSSKFADWLFEQLTDSPPVMVGHLIRDAREAGLLTPATDAKPKPSVQSLYNAKERLPECHEGWDVEEVGIDGRKAWKLVRVDDELTEGDNADSAATPF